MERGSTGLLAPFPGRSGVRQQFVFAQQLPERIELIVGEGPERHYGVAAAAQGQDERVRRFDGLLEDVPWGDILRSGVTSRKPLSSKVALTGASALALVRTIIITTVFCISRNHWMMPMAKQTHVIGPMSPW